MCQRLVIPIVCLLLAGHNSLRAVLPAGQDTSDVVSPREVLVMGFKYFLIRPEAPQTEPGTGKYYTRKGESEYQQYAGRIIRHVKLFQADVFGVSVYDTIYRPASVLEQAANSVHIPSLRRNIWKNILLHAGDIVDPLEIADNERLLREVPYISDVNIELMPVPEDSAMVDVYVFTQDLWSYGAGLQIDGLGSGNASFTISNILGSAHTFKSTLFWRDDKGLRWGYEGIYDVNNILGTFVNSRLRYRDQFGTRAIQTVFSRPFFTPNTQYSGALMYENFLSAYSSPLARYPAQDVPYHANRYDAMLGRSFLIRSSNLLSPSRYNIIVMARYLGQRYTIQPAVESHLMYPFHNRDFYLGGIALSRNNYMKTSLVYSFGVTEDIPYGFLAGINAGYEVDEFYKRPYWGGYLATGAFTHRGHYVYTRVEAGGFSDAGSLRQGVVSADLYYFSNISRIGAARLRHFFGVNYKTGINRFDDEFLTLNNRDGIDGFRSDSLLGMQRLRSQFEVVLFSPLYTFGFRWSFFTHADAGMVAPSTADIWTGRVYSSIGAGIRIRNERLVFNTIQLKFAWYPVSPPYGVTSPVNLNEIGTLWNRSLFVTVPDVIRY